MTTKIEVPEHLRICSRCRGLYTLLAAAYDSDRGASYDTGLDQWALCDRCGATACGTTTCYCKDVLCPHGRDNLREGCV